MPLTFRNGNAYFYRTARDGDRVRREYVASGLAAIGMDRLDREAREEQAGRDSAWRAERDELGGLESLLDEMGGRVGDLVAVVLVRSGYRWRKGSWRKGRTMKAECPAVANEPKAVAVKVEAQAREVFERVLAGEKSAVPALHNFIARNPAATEQFDPARHAEEALAEKAAGSLLGREMLAARLKQVRDELAGPNPTPMERILAERAALCWLDANYADRRHFERETSSDIRPNEYYGRYRDKAHRRFLQAVRALATVRKLASPDVLVGLIQRPEEQTPAARTVTGTDDGKILVNT